MTYSVILFVYVAHCVIVVVVVACINCVYVV